MASNYERIRLENLERYGTATAHLDLLASLYADRTQFLFELLQNAEDAGATWVQFELYPDALETRHNGRPFTPADVEGITGIARGGKRGDLTQIGTFGVGFKSVYAYTRSPRIHSGGEDFEIAGYVQPFPVDPIGTPDTVFVFPFNRPDVPPELAHRELSRALLQLSPRTLLFLTRIEQLDCRTSGGPSKNRSLWRKNSGPGELRKTELFSFVQDGALTSETWLVGGRVIPFPDGNEGRIEAAFALREARGGGMEIDCLPEAQLYAFFPTSKTTHLGFLVQGPFRTTPARDNVPESDPWNRNLVAEAARLVRETLPRLGRAGFASTALLRSLPIRPALFPKESALRPIYDAVLRAVADEALVPAHYAAAVPASQVMLPAVGELRDLFSPLQLAELFGSRNELDWVSRDITPSRHPEIIAYLTGEAGVERVTPDVIVDRLTESFLAAQPSQWIVRLYAFLGDHADLTRLRFQPVVRLEDGRHVAPHSGAAFLPGRFSEGFPCVPRLIAEDDGSLRFLRSLGIAEPEPAEVLRRVIRQGSGFSKSRFLEAWAETPSETQALIAAELSETPFFEAVNAGTGERVRRRAVDLYIRSADLEAFFGESAAVWYLADESMAGIAVRCGGARAPRATPESLAGLGEFLAQPAEQGSRALWNLLVHLRESVDLAKPPDWLRSLRDAPWLPASGGKRWSKPSELESNDLDPAFRRDEATARLLRMRDFVIGEAAEALGVSAAILRFAADNPEVIDRIRLSREGVAEVSNIFA